MQLFIRPQVAHLGKYQQAYWLPHFDFARASNSSLACLTSDTILRDFTAHFIRHNLMSQEGCSKRRSHGVGASLFGSNFEAVKSSTSARSKDQDGTFITTRMITKLGRDHAALRRCRLRQCWLP